MELRGDFKSYAEILDLLQIITMGKKTGEVNLRSNGENITIFFKDGRAIDFTSNSAPIQSLRERVVSGELSLEEAINFILHHVSLWDRGKFLFTERPVDYEGIGSADTLNVMMNFTKEEDELAPEVKEALKKNLYFTLSEEAQLPITITEEAWRILVSICKERPIWDALLFVGRSFSEDTKTLELLLKHKLIKPAEKPPEEEKGVETEKKEEKVSTVPEEKLERVRELLVEAMGPMGEFLIEETLEDLETTELPTNLIRRFIDLLIEKIPDSCLIEGEKCRERLREQISAILKGGANEA